MRGIVRDSATGRPLASATITLAGPHPGAAISVLTSTSGRFTIGRRSTDSLLVVRHIGYAPRSLPTAGISGSDTSLVIALAHLPTLLPSQLVTASVAGCPAASTEAQAAGVLDQARAALLNAVVARQSAAPAATTLLLEQTLDARGRAVSAQRVRVDSARGARPFLAAESPAVFAASGYLREHEGDRLFYAPDADVLLDSSFSSTHCFALRLGAGDHPRDVGIAIEPRDGRTGLVDVAGTIWVDTIEPAVREFDFSYTGLEPAARAAGSGGSIHFATMPNGIVFIDRWSLRTADVRDPPSTSPVPRSRRLSDRTEATVTSVNQTVGQVLALTWPDGTKWQPDAVARGRIVEAATQAPLGGIGVRVAGTDLVTVTSDDGIFELRGLPAARYELDLADTTIGAFSSAAIERASLNVEHGASDVRPVEIRYDGAHRAFAAICGPSDGALLVGRAVLEGDSSAAGAAISATWKPMRTQDAAASAESRGGAADGDGRFAVCGVDAGVPVTVVGRRADRRPANATIVARHGGVARVALTLRPPRVLGLYDATSGAPIDSAEITELSTGNSARTSRTGTVALGFLSHDTALVRIRKLGYPMSVRLVTAGPDDSLPLTELLDNVASLPTVVTSAQANANGMDMHGFDRRRSAGFGRFLDAAQLDSEPPTRVLSYVLTAHGISFGVNRQAASMLNPASCALTVYVDNAIADADLTKYVLAYTTAADWQGIEYYAGPSEVPAELNITGSSGCGLLMLWTKKR